MTEQFCKNCGKPIVVMIQKNTGFCTPRCEDTYTEKQGPVCICPRFKDTGGFRIADLCCPIHGPNGTNPGDGPWDEVE